MIAIARNRSNFVLRSGHEGDSSTGTVTQEDMVLTREQSNGMKGYAILLIMIHNFVDHLMGIGCNEMAYSPSATADFVAMATSQPSVWHFFSFTGWIGVALFLFVSGYGLTRKYGHGIEDKPGFICRHTVKLLLLLIPVYLLYVVVQHYWCGEPHNWQSVIAQLTFTINLLSYGDNGFVIEPGVYWFFGAILQFYLLFLSIRRWRASWLIIAMACAIVLHYFFLYFTNDDTMWWFRQNCIGWGAPFLLGMIAAKSSWQPTKPSLLLLCATSLILLFISLGNKPLMPFTEVFTILFFGSLVLMLNLRIINAIGVISASIFVIHPFVRMTFYKAFENSELGVTPMIVIYFVTVMLLSVVHFWFYRKFSTKENMP